MDPLHLKPIENEAALANLFASVPFRALFFISMVIAVALVPITYWALDNAHPYVLNAEESYILPTHAHGNDQMIVVWKVKTERHCEGIKRRELFDPRTKVILAVYDPVPTIRYDDIPFGETFLLPRQIQTGRIAYRSRLEFWCNPLQRIWPIKYTSPELYFTVQE
jgi:hypothetical protein